MPFSLPNFSHFSHKIYDKCILSAIIVQIKYQEVV